MRNSLRTRLTISFISLAIVPLLLVGAVLAQRSFTSQRTQALALQREISRRVASDVTAFMAERENELDLLTQIRGLQGLEREDQTRLLSGLLARENVYEELTLIDAQGQEILHLSRVEILPVDSLDTRVGTAEFESPKSTGETHFSSVKFNEQTGEPFMTIAIPLTNLRSGEFEGALAADFRFKTVWDLMASAELSGNGIVYVVDADGEIIAHRNPSVVLQGTRFDLPEEDGFYPGLDGTDVVLAVNRIRLGEQIFDIVAETPTSEALALAISAVYITGGAIVVAVLAASILGVLAALQITRPIDALAKTAQSISDGDLSQRVTATRQDEIGTLATAFNSMTVQLNSLIDSLEQRVAARTKALAASLEVSRSLSTILDQEQLVSEVVQQVQQTFNYYHAHIYLFDDLGDRLIMVGGTGEAGQSMLTSGHAIPKGKGLVGRAAMTAMAVLIPDVAQEDDWLPNPLLPDTKAEVALPIVMRNQVMGVLDVQHDVVNGLTQEDVNLLQSVANQVAIGLQNAHLLRQAEQRADNEALINAISQKIQNAMTVEDVLQIAAEELGQALHTQQASVQLSLRKGSGNGRDPSHT